MAETPRLAVVTGICASGKSTVAGLLVRRFDRAVLLDGDVIRRMVVTGRAEMTPDPSEEALAQYGLRLRHLAALADSYAEAGFTVIVEDNIFGAHLKTFVDRLATRPVHVVVLVPEPAVVARREAARDKAAYGLFGWTPESLDHALRTGTAPIGLWLDTSRQRPEETVDEIVGRWADSAVR
jgi:predicted kinase